MAPSRCLGSPLTAQKKSFMDKDSSSAEMIDGLLGIMPVGCRNVTYLPASAIETLQKDDSTHAPRTHTCTSANTGRRRRRYIPSARAVLTATASLFPAGIKDIHKLPGVQHFSHGPYLDDWSKVPADIAAKYNTSPSFKP